jgi:Tfp pilus assembly protein PilN
MPIQAGEGKTAVALFVDGLELKYVRLSAKGNEITLRDFKTVALVQKFEDKQSLAATHDDTMPGEFSSTDAFSTAAPIEPQGEGNTNAAVLFGLLNEIGNPRKYTLSYAIVEPAVAYQEYESDFGLSGVKLKKRIIEELAGNRTNPIPLDALNVIPTSSGGQLAIIREDGLPLFDLMTEVKSFMGDKIPNLKLINSVDVVLMEMVRTQYELQEEEVTVLVYVGHDFSRIIFMQGEHYLHFAPIISEGYESPNIENTIYSRILLEQDNIMLTRMDRILLAGESHKINMLDAIAPQFSSAQVEYIKAPTLELGAFEGSLGDVISEYAIPLMTAWQVLEPKNTGFYNINFIPPFILERQRSMTLAWHGFLVAALLSATIAFFILQIPARSTVIKRAKIDLATQQQKLNELDVFRARREQLTADINRYSNATSVYDQIAPGSDRWSRILHYIANSVEDLNSVWIYSIQSAPGNSQNILISGRALYRGRIARIASAFERATLKEVRTKEIRKKIVYEFDLVVEQVDKHDVAEPAYK